MSGACCAAGEPRQLHRRGRLHARRGHRLPHPALGHVGDDLRHRGALGEVQELEVRGELGRVFGGPELRALAVLREQVLEDRSRLHHHHVADVNDGRHAHLVVLLE
jgi:hypothetical protein